MTKQLKKILFLISIFLTFIISCQYEETIEHQHYQENIIPVQKIHLKELLNDKKFNSSFASLKRAKYKTNVDELGRSSLEDTFNFTIIDSTVKVMSNDNNTYYTLLIQTDGNTDNLLENLVLLEETDTETIGYYKIQYFNN